MTVINVYLNIDAVIIRCIYMWLVTSVCLYIYMSLMYERVLEKCFWGTGKSWKSPGNFSEQKCGNPAYRSMDYSCVKKLLIVVIDRTQNGRVQSLYISVIVKEGATWNVSVEMNDSKLSVIVWLCRSMCSTELFKL